MITYANDVVRDRLSANHGSSPALRIRPSLLVPRVVPRRNFLHAARPGCWRLWARRTVTPTPIVAAMLRDPRLRSPLCRQVRPPRFTKPVMPCGASFVVPSAASGGSRPDLVNEAVLAESISVRASTLLSEQ